MKPKTARFGRKIKGMGGTRHLSVGAADSSPLGEPFYFARPKASPRGEVPPQAAERWPLSFMRVRVTFSKNFPKFSPADDRILFDGTHIV